MLFIRIIAFSLPNFYLLQDEDEELARALQLSVGADPSTASVSAFSDPSFASSLLSAADPNDPLVQAALAQLQQQQQAQSGSSGSASAEDESNNDATGKKRKGDDK